MTKEKDGSVLYAVYGTLRQGQGNNRVMGESEYLGTMQTPAGYTMYGANNGFPYVAEGGETPITVEIFRASRVEDITRINRLESYSGVRNHPGNWYDTCDVQTEWGVANMFIRNQARERNDVIASGDWTKR